MKAYEARETNLTTIFDGQDSDAVATPVRVKKYDALAIQIATTAGTDGAFKVRGSKDKNADLTAVQSVSNIWDYKRLNNENTGSGVNGSTGVVPAGIIYREYKVNLDGMHWFAGEVTGRTAGAYTVKFYGISIHGT